MRDVVGRVRKFRLLQPHERRFLICVCLAAPCFTGALRLLGLRRLLAWNAARWGPLPRQADLEQLRRLLAVAASALSALPIHSSCLVRALAYQWLLRRDGIHTQLRIGAQLIDRRLDAHAWLEIDGQPITDHGDALRRFAAFESFASSGLRSP